MAWEYGDEDEKCTHEDKHTSQLWKWVAVINITRSCECFRYLQFKRYFKPVVEVCGRNKHHPLTPMFAVLVVQALLRM